MAFRKRVFATAFKPNNNRSNKRRRVNRRRKSSNGKKVTAFTSQSAFGSGIGFKARRMRKRAYKNAIWKSTIFKKHWRSCNSTSSLFLTPAGSSLVSAELSTALRFSGNNFWVTAGGAINPDGGAVGTFPSDEDFIIRGGKVGIRVCNVADVLGTTPEAIQVWVYLIKTSSGYNPGALASSYSLGWDPSLVTDFNTLLGRIVYRKQFLLKDGDVTDVEYRLKLQKIDASDYSAGRNTYVWLYLASNVDSNAARGLTITPYYNISFTADQI